MSQARVVFLAVLVVFFCTLFIGSYIWMRRPRFGQVGGRTVRARRAPVPRQSGEAAQKGPVKSPSAPVSWRFSP
jgi:ABC-type Fe3+ transport system permease subunit